MSHSKSELVCRQCGQPDAHQVGDEILCAACCHERGSCGAVRDDDVPDPQREERGEKLI